MIASLGKEAVICCLGTSLLFKMFITFSISEMLNVIIRLNGGFEIEHSLGIAKIRKLGMVFERYNGASQGSINTLKPRIM